MAGLAAIPSPDEYQIDVSVWLALDLVLAAKLTHELVLEPASQEDVEGSRRVRAEVGLPVECPCLTTGSRFRQSPDR